MRQIHADGTPFATLLLAHGYGEHTGRYVELEESLARAGFDVLSYDMPGHGRADGKRATVDIAELIDLHLQQRAEARSLARTDQLALFGHSMGGLITASSALINPRGIDAVVLSGPAFRPLPAVPTMVAKAGYALARFFPSLPVVSLDPADISSVPRVVARYEHDELNYHGRVPALTGTSMTLHGHTALERATTWDDTLPLLVFHGTDDKLAHIEGSREFVAAVRMAGGPAALIEVPGAFHEVFNEPQAPQLREQMETWLRDQLSARR